MRSFLVATRSRPNWYDIINQSYNNTRPFHLGDSELFQIFVSSNAMVISETKTLIRCFL